MYLHMCELIYMFISRTFFFFSFLNKKKKKKKIKQIKFHLKNEKIKYSFQKANKYIYGNLKET